METTRLRVEVPREGHHRRLISCQDACPVHTDARGYVRAIAEGRFEAAYLIARRPNPFASICGRICGEPCEAACRRGKIPRFDDEGTLLGADRPVAIRALKRFVCDRFGPESRPAREILDGVVGWSDDSVAQGWIGQFVSSAGTILCQHIQLAGFTYRK